MEKCDQKKTIDKLVDACDERKATEGVLAMAIQRIQDKLESMEEKFSEKFEEIIKKQDEDRKIINRHDRIIFAVKWLVIGGCAFAVAQKIGITEFVIQLFT